MEKLLLFLVHRLSLLRSWKDKAIGKGNKDRRVRTLGVVLLSDSTRDGWGTSEVVDKVLTHFHDDVVS